MAREWRSQLTNANTSLTSYHYATTASQIRYKSEKAQRVQCHCNSSTGSFWPLPDQMTCVHMLQMFPAEINGHKNTAKKDVIIHLAVLNKCIAVPIIISNLQIMRWWRSSTVSTLQTERLRTSFCSLILWHNQIKIYSYKTAETTKYSQNALTGTWNQQQLSTKPNTQDDWNLTQKKQKQKTYKSLSCQNCIYPKHLHTSFTQVTKMSGLWMPYESSNTVQYSE